jgi:hypothetical protein
MFRNSIKLVSGIGSSKSSSLSKLSLNNLVLKNALNTSIRLMNKSTGKSTNNSDEIDTDFVEKDYAISSDVFFTSGDSQTNQKAENISRAMAYYLDKLSKRGSFFVNVCLFCTSFRKYFEANF